MLNTGKLTGKYDSSGYIGVKLAHGEELFARPMCQVPIVANYTSHWVEKYGDNFIAVVGYENDVRERPLLLGLIPLKNPKFPEEKYEEQNYFFTTVNFRVWANDKENELVVDSLEDGGKIKLGNKDVDEPGVLGNVAVDLLNEFIEDIGKLSAIQTNTGITGLISTSPQWQGLVTKWQEKWKDFNSETVFLKE